MLVTDSISRFGSIEQACQLIFNLRIQRDIEIYIPKQVDLRDSNPSLNGVALLISEFSSVRAELKSKRIKHALWIKSQLQGRIHDSGISAELKRIVIEEHEKCGAVRKTARNLKAKGHDISASSVSRILKEAKSNG
ncbi:MAG: hypothetical protein K1X29_08175 [Bdellovibrionales bacterium]|nr:hypothetical protein [Bdellovibrionales bacterium]